MQNVLGRIGDWVLGWIMSILLILLPTSFYFQFVITQPAEVKLIIKNSHVYDKIASSFIDQMTSQIKSSPESNELPLNDPRIAEIFKTSISPSDTQKYTEITIDSIYALLDGKSSGVAGVIDYSSNKNAIIEQLGNYSGERLNTLPKCTYAQMRQISEQYNTFNTPCIPIGSSVGQLTDQLKAELRTSQTPLAKDSLVIKDTALGKFITERSQKYQTYYSLAKKAFWVNLALAVLVLAGYIYRHRRRKQQAIYGIMLKNAITLAFLASISLFLFSKNPSNSMLGQNAFGKDVVLPIGYGFVSKFAHIEYTIGAIYLVLAIVAWILFKKIKKPVSGPK